MSPSSFDPSLNNAECVVEDSSKDRFQNVKKIFPQMCWVYWLFSLFGGYFITMIFIQLYKEIMNKNNNDKITFVKATLYFLFLVFCLGVISSITAICYSAEGDQVAYPLVYLFSITLTFLRGVLCPNIHIDELKETRFRYTVDPGCFIVVHYLLWMIIGAITEPFWAIPIVTSCATLTFLFYFLAFFCFSSYRNWKSGRDIENLIILVLTIFSIICVQFSYFVAGSHFFNEGLVSSIIQSVLIVILSFWFKFFKDSNPPPEADENPLHDNVGLRTSNSKTE